MIDREVVREALIALVAHFVLRKMEQRRAKNFHPETSHASLWTLLYEIGEETHNAFVEKYRARLRGICPPHRIASGEGSYKKKDAELMLRAMLHLFRAVQDDAKRKEIFAALLAADEESFDIFVQVAAEAPRWGSLEQAATAVEAAFSSSATLMKEIDAFFKNDARRLRSIARRIRNSKKSTKGGKNA